MMDSILNLLLNLYDLFDDHINSNSLSDYVILYKLLISDLYDDNHIHSNSLSDYVILYKLLN